MNMMLRRDLRLFGRELGLCLAVLLLLSAVAVGAIFTARARDADRVVADVVLCDEDDSILSRMAVNLVLQQEFAGRSLSVTRAAREEGLALLRDGHCHAVIVLPEGYLDALMCGAAGELKIYLSPAAEKEAVLVERLAEVGRVLIAAGQCGVFAGEHLIWAAEMPEEVHEAYLTEINTALIDRALGAYDEYFTVETLPAAAMSAALRSFLALLGFAMFLLPAMFTALYKQDRSSDVYSRLRALGLSRAVFYCGKLLYPALLDMAVCALALTAARHWFGPDLGGVPIPAVCAGAVVMALCSSGLCILQKPGRGLPTAALLGTAAAMMVML